MAYRIGIDAGSKTIKLVVLDESGRLVHATYQRHRSNIRRTLTSVLRSFLSTHGNLQGTVALTGSAGIAVAKTCGLPFVQEVIATTTAVRQRIPQADAFIELGGEDAKVVYLTGRPEQRMNATCAGGTGGFIDNVARMIGVPTAEINQLARRAEHIHPIASRCAVFAETDIRPLLNSGATKEDLAASTLEAVVRQTLGGLACGRPLRGTIVFLGGPLAHIPELARRFRTALDLTDKTGIRPADAHLFTAMGAAIESATQEAGGEIPASEPTDGAAAPTAAPTAASPASANPNPAGSPAAPDNLLTLQQLLDRVVNAPDPEDDLPHLPPLFASDQERADFERRHARSAMPSANMFTVRGPLYLGFDAGSTTIKYALIDQQGRLVAHDYRHSQGNVLETALSMLTDLYHLMSGCQDAYLAQTTAIGYGADLLRAALRLDHDAVETVAHLRAAQALRPDVSFVLDIGGQDMKALWIQDGQIVDAVLNEACSSGCGSFVEGSAHALRCSPSLFAAEALAAPDPLDLGTKCTVFMNSRVRHAQKVGASRANIAAGIVYSVVQNALYRVIGRNRLASMGSAVVVQGGTFKSDAVLRAFEKLTGVQATRPNHAHLMGAIGAALIARDRAAALQGDENFAPNRADAGGPADVAAPDAASPFPVRSTVVHADEIARIQPRYQGLRCDRCPNACALSVVSFGDGRSFVSGNQCPRGQECAAQAADAAPGRAPQPGTVGSQHDLAVSRRRAQQQPRTGAAGATRLPEPRKRTVQIVPPRHLRAQANTPALDLARLLEQELAAFGQRPGRGPLAHVTLGLVPAFFGEELLPFWHSFFGYLGFSLLDVPAEPLSPAEPGSSCAPVRLARHQVQAYAQAGADAVFLPRYQRECLCESADLCMDSLAESATGPHLLCPTLSRVRPEALARTDADLDQLHQALHNLAPQADLTPNRVLDAVRYALNEQLDFEKRLGQMTENALISIRTAQQGQDHKGENAAGTHVPAAGAAPTDAPTDASDPTDAPTDATTEAPAAMVLGTRPCHQQRSLLDGLAKALSEQGTPAIPAHAFELVCRRTQAENAVSTGRQRHGHVFVGQLWPESAWRPSDRAVSTLLHLRTLPDLEYLPICDTACDLDRTAQPVLSSTLETALRPTDQLPLQSLATSASAQDALQALEPRQSQTRKERRQRHDQERKAQRGTKSPSANASESASAAGSIPSSEPAPSPASGLAPEPAAAIGGAWSGLAQTARPVRTATAADPANVPNVVRFQQERIAAYGTVRPTAYPLTVGLLGSLEEYEALPFWHTLFAQLGFGVRVASRSQTTDVKNAAAESIPSESVCHAAKLSHARLYQLQAAGVDAVFLPRYQRMSRCPVLCGYNDALLDSVEFLRTGQLLAISPVIQAFKPRKLARNHDQLQAVYRAVADFAATAAGPSTADPSADPSAVTPTPSPAAASTPNPLTWDDFQRALDAALAEFDTFTASIRAESERALAWVHADPTRAGVVLAGRPYHMDPALTHGVDRILQELGLAVLCPLGLTERTASIKAYSGWKPAKHLLKLGRFVVSDPAMHLVVMQSFGCGFDATSIKPVRAEVTAASHGFVSLKTDEIVDTAHLRIRLRTMAESLRPASALQPASAPVPAATIAPAAVASDAPKLGTLPEFPDATPEQAAQAKPLITGPLDAHVLEAARALCSADVCFTAAALVAQAVQRIQDLASQDEDPARKPIVLAAPRTCQLCITDSLPALVASVLGEDRMPVIAWEHADTTQLTPPTPSCEVFSDESLDFFAQPTRPGAILRTTAQDPDQKLRTTERATADEPDAAALGTPASPTPAADPDTPASPATTPDARTPVRVGIVGNPLLCFDPFMNEGLADLLKNIGAEPVWPDPENIYVDDVTYLPQLDQFAADGVETVLYLQSFGCMKGHVQARGNANALAARYPGMPVTVIDYDPESSALNRENRIRLAVSAARRARS